MGLKIVVLENFAGIPDDPVARDLFVQMAAIKLKGYSREHGSGVIALDSTDYYGTHLLMGEADAKGRLRLLGGFRSVRASELEHYGAPFPTVTLLEQAGLHERAAVVRRILESARERSVEVSYDSSFSILPEARERPGLSRQLRDLMTVMCIHYHAEQGVPEWITQGVVRFKVDEYLAWMGLRRLTEPFPLSTLRGEPGVALHFERASTEALFVARAKRGLWESRLVVSGGPVTARLSRKAA